MLVEMNVVSQSLIGNVIHVVTEGKAYIEFLSQSLIGNVIQKKNPPIEISLDFDMSQSLIGNVIR